MKFAPNTFVSYLLWRPSFASAGRNVYALVRIIEEGRATDHALAFVLQQLQQIYLKTLLGKRRHNTLSEPRMTSSRVTTFSPHLGIAID